jgi:hypothetical protein
MLAAERRVAVAGRSDRAGDDSLAFRVAGDGGAESLDHTDGLVSDDQALSHRILALADVHVRSADRRRRDPDERIERTDVRDRLLVENDPAGFDEHGRLHLCHGPFLRWSRVVLHRACRRAAARTGSEERRETPRLTRCVA